MQNSLWRVVIFWRAGGIFLAWKTRWWLSGEKKILQIHHVWDLILRTIFVIFGHSPFHQMARVFVVLSLVKWQVLETLPGHCTVKALSSINNPSMDKVRPLWKTFLFEFLENATTYYILFRTNRSAFCDCYVFLNLIM